MNLNNQLYMTKYVRNYLTNEANRTQLLPANSGIEGGNIESQISEYNNLLLQRNSLVSNSSTQNPWSSTWTSRWPKCARRSSSRSTT